MSGGEILKNKSHGGSLRSGDQAEGLLLWGINNIYGVLAGGLEWECRIKGKILRGRGDEYSPLVPGDQVRIEIDDPDRRKAMILERRDRENGFSRWNRKRDLLQTLAANIDLLVCLASPSSPPFRPRFIDRVLVMAEEHFPVLIVMNKADQLAGLNDPEKPGGAAGEIRERLENYAGMGYPFLLCSAKTGEGLDDLVARLEGKTAAFVGQSGVGKSSLLNRLDPGFRRTVGEISEKYNRGRHTTNYGILLPWRGGGLMDTPGIREIHLWGIEPRDLAHFMPDLRPYIPDCALPGCLHTAEPRCAIRTAAEEGKIHPDRYESYLRMLESL